MSQIMTDPGTDNESTQEEDGDWLCWGDLNHRLLPESV